MRPGSRGGSPIPGDGQAHDLGLPIGYIISNFALSIAINRLDLFAKGVSMKRNLLVLAALSVLVSLTASQAESTGPAQARITREVRHELLMLPYFGVFDNIEYRVGGNTVTLLGQVTRPTLKSDAESAVKRIEGVEKVVNDIEVLPVSTIDDQLRLALYHAIYGYPALEKYALGVQKPIRIIVKNGRVSLEGVVDSDADRTIAGVRANSVPGIFAVTNNLHVA